MTQTISWPPSYRIKKHAFAKHVKLRAGSDHCLEITIPVRFNLKKIPSILEDNKKWIIDHLSRIPVRKNDVYPETVVLHALNQTWKVHYVTCDSKLEMFVRPTQEIVFVGKQQSVEFYKKNLVRWLKRYCKKYLSEKLDYLSQRTCMEFDTLTIRDQKTLWGSCTVNKTISLNYKLIFLPVYLLEHVMIHELCHTIHLNHSESFWKKVAEYDPNWQQHKRELRKANQYLPEWV